MLLIALQTYVHRVCKRNYWHGWTTFFELCRKLAHREQIPFAVPALVCDEYMLCYFCTNSGVNFPITTVFSNTTVMRFFSFYNCIQRFGSNIDSLQRFCGSLGVVRFLPGNRFFTLPDADKPALSAIHVYNDFETANASVAYVISRIV